MESSCSIGDCVSGIWRVRYRGPTRSSPLDTDVGRCMENRAEAKTKAKLSGGEWSWTLADVMMLLHLHRLGRCFHGSVVSCLVPGQGFSDSMLFLLFLYNFFSHTPTSSPTANPAESHNSATFIRVMYCIVCMFALQRVSVRILHTQTREITSPNHYFCIGPMNKQAVAVQSQPSSRAVPTWLYPCSMFFPPIV